MTSELPTTDGSAVTRLPVVRQLRVVVEVNDFDAAHAFFRDALGLDVRLATSGPAEAKVCIFEAGLATLEIVNSAHKHFVDEVEVGRAVAPPFRLAFHVDDARTVTSRLANAGAAVIAEPVETPWRSLNARLVAPGDVQLTVFEELATAESTPTDLDVLVSMVIDLAVDNARTGMLPFAAVVVDVRGGVVATGVNTVLRSADVTAHAEVEAVRAACRRLGTSDLTGMTLISSCQPCALCQATCVAAGIAQITYAAKASDVPDLGGIQRPDAVVLQQAAQNAMPDFIVHRHHARAIEPFTEFLAPSG